MEKYKKYKDSGVEWLGEIPSHWQHKKVKHLLVPAKKSGILAGDAKEDGEFPFFTCSPIVKRIDKAVYHEPSIMLSTGGTACVNYCDGDFSTSTDTYVLQKYENMKFMYYFLYGFTQVINDFGFEGMGLKHLQKSFLNNMDVYLPDKVEIDRIVKYLDTKTQAMDSAISKKQQLVEKLKLAKQALITETVTKGLDPTVPMKDSGVEWIGEIPEHWNVVRTKYIMNKLKRHYNVYDEVVTAYRNGRVTLRSNVRDDGYTFADKEIGYQGVQKGDFVVHQMDSFAGALGVSDSNGKCSPVYTVCKCKEDIVSNYYIAYLYSVMAKKGHINALAKGIRERSVDFRYSTMSEVSVCIPTIIEQTQIVGYLDKKVSEFDQLIKLEEQSIEKLKLTKQKLITEVVTGKIKVIDL